MPFEREFNDPVGIQTRVESKDKARVVKLAKKRKESQADVVREAVLTFLDAAEGKATEPELKSVSIGGAQPTMLHGLALGSLKMLTEGGWGEVGKVVEPSEAEEAKLQARMQLLIEELVAEFGDLDGEGYDVATAVKCRGRKSARKKLANALHAFCDRWNAGRAAVVAQLWEKAK